MMVHTTDYRDKALEDARNTARNYLKEIITKLREDGEASNDLFNDYPYGCEYHDDRHPGRSYTLLESATVLDQLSQHKEDDSGLWSRLDPQDAVCAQAEYTYGNAVLHYWQEIIKEINKDAESGILTDMLGEDDPADNSVIEGRINELIEEM